MEYASLPQEVDFYPSGAIGENPDEADKADKAGTAKGKGKSKGKGKGKGSPSPAQIRAAHPALEEWPTQGAVSFKDVHLRYAPGLPLALAGVTFNVRGGGTVGICGRSGSGKSTLSQALFRLRDIERGGCVAIDGRDISTVSLHVLRERLTMIPQDPVLMRGSVAQNLDPFGEFSRLEMRAALDSAGLTEDRVRLDDVVEDSGRNWSAGERQLLCFARAFLRPNKVLVADEPSSSIDANLDDYLQQVLRDFQRTRQCTIICVAHRLRTICQYDHILVMEDGKVKEMDSPRALLADAASEFHSMVAATGDAEKAHIYKTVFGDAAPKPTPQQEP